MKIFHLDCSVEDENSLTRKYSQAIVNKLSKKYSDVEVIYDDIIENPIPFLDKKYKNAMFTPSIKLNEESIKTLKTFDIMPFAQADIYVLGVPGYFFNVPASFKNWQEHLFRFGVTVNEQWQGLLQNKKMYVVSAWGGIYADTYIEHAFEQVIKKGFETFGIYDIKFFNIFNDVATQTNNIKKVEKEIENFYF